MKLIKLIGFILLFFSNPSFAQQNFETKEISFKPFCIGQTVELYSQELSENRTLNIYLPNGYSPDSIKKYPVIYLLDGSADEDFIHIAGIVQFGSFSWINMLPESIVVGISNTDRKRDFTYPTSNQEDKVAYPTTGGSENFIRFIEKELQPFIEKRYRIENTKTLIGQSLGGLLATEILLKKPELFDNYIIVSPSLWWDDESLAQENPKPIEANQIVYIAVGKEGEVMERVAKELTEKLELVNKSDHKIYFDYFGDQDHANILHLAVYQAFEKIFKIPENQKER